MSVPAAALQPLSLRANFSWTLSGNLVYAGCQWAMLVALAKLTSPGEVGRFALGLAVTAPIFMFANLQLRAVQATDARREVRFADYFALRLRTTALAFGLACAVAAFGPFARETAVVIVALACAKVMDSLADVHYGLWQQHEQMDRIARSLALRGVLALAFLVAGVLAGHQAVWGALGMTLAWGLVLFGNDLPGRAVDAGRAADLRTRKERARSLRHLVWLGLPLGLVMLLISLNANLPRYFLDHARGPADLGVFAALASALLAGSVLVNALGQSATPRMARLAMLGDRAGFARLLWKLLALAAALGALGIAAAATVGRPVVTLLFTPEYGAHSAVLVTVMVAAALGFAASFLGYAMTALRVFHAQVPLFLATCAATAGWAAFDVPRAGIAGAARALVGCAIVQLAGSAFLVARSLPAGRRP